MGLCQDPCEFANACAASAKCKAKMHRPICSCPPGHLGNPTIKCMPTEKAIECFEDSDCSITEACINQRCQHPCDVHDPCAQNAICVNTNHAADCNCSYGYEGNGYIGCQPGLCCLFPFYIYCPALNSTYLKFLLFQLLQHCILWQTNCFARV
ncbi:hypothetical protein GQX74_002305 [Glossina fuscipes]|nr:hypothetical protein GQX74_002305 [Glossina fuscipes]